MRADNSGMGKLSELNDWLSCGFMSRTTKIGHFWDDPQANLLAWYGKTKPNTTKAHIHQTTEIYKTQNKVNKHKKLKPGLVASYDIWPGNGKGLFWFWRFINLSLTYLLFRHPLTYNPRPMGQTARACSSLGSSTLLYISLHDGLLTAGLQQAAAMTQSHTWNPVVPYDFCFFCKISLENMDRYRTQPFVIWWCHPKYMPNTISSQ